MTDLFAAAQGRAPEIEQNFELKIENGDPDFRNNARQFASWVEENAAISVNAPLFVITELLNNRPYQNIYEWAEEQSGVCGRAVEELLRDRLKQWYDRRLRLDSTIVQGRYLRYGSLNVGSVGLTTYGAYCLVMSADWMAALEQNVAYWSGDSLVVFWNTDGNFDTAAFLRHLSPHSCRHLMVAIELADTVSADENDWPRLASREGKVYEVAFLAGVTLGGVASVRVLESEYERLVDLMFEGFGRKLPPAEAALVHDFFQLRRAETEGRLRIEVVN